MDRVLVTGVRGKTGVPLAALLAARGGVEVRGGSSDPRSVDLPGVVPTAFSWDDPDGWRAAADDVDAVFVVRPDRLDAPDLVAGLLGVLPPHVHVVLLSERRAEETGGHDWAVRVERAVTSREGSWTVLRPGWFMQVLTDPRFFRDLVLDDGALPFPSRGARLAWVDVRDIAAVAAEALLAPDVHDGVTYEITGPEPLSLPETAALLAAATGREVEHRDVTDAEALEGTGGFERELTALTYDRVRAGVFADPTDDVERVTGRPPRSLRTFLADAGPDLTGGVA
ncbi:nucleoside-diphosphate sugar epimerase [Phycicoccus sp. BSK3Z-2]|uniref:Nucleoside-diphosphate sugar epimerase n=1 Tax=Phycicoccus avicenniae TaxID=2828860 RepID=A0A941HZA7_9MICO|nr:nucleoside-diphosphate sugar epimerase [Phycicoccus avicenniae]MBR7742026.1 nucleoside-diphosphate sugar epimerase [Phycicoccus avicenniae]